MVARPGRRQAAFVGGELDERLFEREELKVFSTGLSRAENVHIAPQGDFRQREGLRDIGALDSDAARIFPFTASDGSAYDLVFRPGEFSAWSATALLETVSMAALTSAMLAEITVAQQYDTMLVFHADLRTQRVKHAGPASWSVDNAPYENLPTYDYGGPVGGGSYTNGVAAVWQLEFVGLTSGDTIFTLTVSNQETASIVFDSNMDTMASAIQSRISDLANVASGISVAKDSVYTSTRVNITFSGTENLGDQWAVSGTIANKSDAAILASKLTPGVKPGEPVISTDRGWPQCGAFYAQRLLVGGLNALPNAWMFSAQGDYYNFDTRLASAATGPALVPMDLPGGERIEHIVPSQNLVIMTGAAEYWLASRTLSATEAPDHVQASTNGTAPGVPVVASESALYYAHKDGGVISEFRSADYQGNYISEDISLFASHLVKGVVDQALRRGTLSTDGNFLGLVQSDGAARQVTMLREQDITAFCQLTTADGSFIAHAVNGRNEGSFITARPAGRRLERFEDGLLLDEAMDFSLDPASDILTGLDRFNGRSGIWALADGDVFGPFTIAGGALTLPVAASAVTVGSWQAPVVTTLPLSVLVGTNTVVKKRRRIHSVNLSVIDTTSLAIATNDGALRDVPLRRYGQAADVAELEAGYTGQVSVRGLVGYADDPTVTISQLRPGRLNVRSITIEATQ